MGSILRDTSHHSGGHKPSSSAGMGQTAEVKVGLAEVGLALACTARIATSRHWYKFIMIGQVDCEWCVWCVWTEAGWCANVWGTMQGG